MKEIEVVMKDLNKKVIKLVDIYFMGLEKDCFKEVDDGIVSVMIKNVDIVNLMN